MRELVGPVLVCQATRNASKVSEPRIVNWLSYGPD